MLWQDDNESYPLGPPLVDLQSPINLKYHFLIFLICYICPQNLGYSEVPKSVAMPSSLVLLEVESQNFADVFPASRDIDTNQFQPIFLIYQSIKPLSHGTPHFFSTTL